MAAKLTELDAFVCVAKHLSFQKAALERGVSRSAVSHAVARLERSLGARLLNRNTRSVSLTEAGSILFSRLERAFSGIDEALEELNRFSGATIGTLRLNVPHAVASALLGPILAELSAEHPSLVIEVTSNDAIVDSVAEGFDAGIRFGNRLEQDMIALRIPRALAFAAVATKAYLDAAPPLERPADLAGHRCILYRFPSGAPFHWEFEKDGENVVVDVPGSIVLHDQELMIEVALAGAGVAYVFEDRVRHHLETGRLERRLADWCPDLSDLYLYYSSRRHVSAGLRALIRVIHRQAGRSAPRHP